MTRAALAMLALAATAVLLAPVSGGAPAPARLQVTATDFHLALSRKSVRAGPIVIELVNFGEDDHDLLLHRLASGSRVRRLPVTRPEHESTLETTLKAGRYRLWCSVGNHAGLGMTAVLRVRSR